MKSTENYLKTALDEIREHPGDMTAEQITELWTPAREALDVYRAALDAYDADLTARRAVLEQQAEELDRQLAGFEGEMAALESESREAASRADLDAAAEADERADALRKKAATIRRKRRIANAGELRGDKSLYDKIVASKAAFDWTYAQCADAAREAADYVKTLATTLERLERTARFTARYGPAVCGADEKRRAAIDAAFAQS